DGLATDDGRVFRLEPLRRRLADRDPAEWEEAVRSHFDTLLAVDPSMPATFDEAAPGLRAAAVAESDLGLFDGALMERPLVDGLGERLMLRRGPLGMTVTTEAVRRWRVDAPRVWERARSGSLWDVALAMLRHAMSSYVESPLPVGCDLFWWDDGTLHRICTPAGGRYRYIRVPAFSAMLWRLDEAAAGRL